MINIFYSRLFRSERLEPARIREELSRQTFGQEGAVAEIVTAITLFSQQDNEPEHRKLLLLPFIGWVGVGKVAQNREIKIGLENIFIPLYMNQIFFLWCKPGLMQSFYSKQAALW